MVVIGWVAPMYIYDWGVPYSVKTDEKRMELGKSAPAVIVNSQNLKK